MANEITERHGAKPYGFQFVEQIVAEPIDDGEGGTLRVEPKEVFRSGMYFIGGKLIRYDDVPDDQDHRIMRSNMRSNRHPICCETRRSYRWTSTFKAEDFCVDEDGAITVRGDDDELTAYRAAKIAEWEATP
jgi:hypothetical protein